MRYFLLTLFFFVSSGWALPECSGEYWDNCMAAYTYDNSEKYVGEWKDDKRNGQGTNTMPSGQKYVGEWKDDKPHGQGVETYDNGEKYTGEFRNEKKNGQGIYTWPDGDKYVGEFRNNEPNGQGTYTYPDGFIDEGIWKDGDLISKKETIANEEPSVTEENTIIPPESDKEKKGLFDHLLEKIKPLDKEDEQLQFAGTGTAFAISEFGYFVTNSHVVSNFGIQCDEIVIEIRIHGGKADLIDHNENDDLALLKADFKTVTVFPISQRDPYLQEAVYAAGFPFGYEYGNTINITDGIISSVGQADSPFFRTSIAINPGNSGGPIYNPEGNVVGVVMATARIREVEQEFGMLPENYNFGIKSSALRSFIDTHDIEIKAENTSKKTNFKLGRDARAATYYIACLMSDAKMKEIEKHREVLSEN